MKPSIIRERLKQWLNQQLRIDRWGLNSPESVKNMRAPPSSGFDGKASGYSILETIGSGEASNYLLETSIPFQIIYRFDSGWNYTQIPRAEAEDALTAILLQIQVHQGCISPDINAIESQGTVTVNEQAKSDWILTFEIEFKIQFHCEFAELTPIKGVFGNDS